VTGVNDAITSSTTYTLEFNSSSAANTVTLTKTNIITSGGILVTPGVGNNSSLITSGTLQSAGADLIVNEWDTQSQLTISSVINTGAFTKSGPGTVTLTGADSYGGATNLNAGTLIVSGSISGSTAVNINQGATLQLGASGSIKNNATVTLNGGTLNAEGFSLGSFNGTSETAGAGTLNVSYNSIIDFGASSTKSVLAFSGAGTYSSGWIPFAGKLTIYDWNGTIGSPDGSAAGVTADALFITGNATTLGQAELSEIQFYIGGVDYAALQATDGEVYASGIALTAIPEPGTWATAIAGLGLLICGQRMRRRL
jgi:autotransporter-associated beta strand protein